MLMCVFLSLSVCALIEGNVVMDKDEDCGLCY